MIRASLTIMVKHTSHHIKKALWLFVALLEEERRSNSQQTEESTKQIQYLQSKYTHKHKLNSNILYLCMCHCVIYTTFLWMFSSAWEAAGWHGSTEGAEGEHDPHHQRGALLCPGRGTPSDCFSHSFWFHILCILSRFLGFFFPGQKWIWEKIEREWQFSSNVTGIHS